MARFVAGLNTNLYGISSLMGKYDGVPLRVVGKRVVFGYLWAEGSLRRPMVNKPLFQARHFPGPASSHQASIATPSWTA